MTDCVYCGTVCLSDQALFRDDIHQKCFDELGKRNAMGLCAKCGSRDELNAGDNPRLCANCPGKEFYGYPGP